MVGRPAGRLHWAGGPQDAGDAWQRGAGPVQTTQPEGIERGGPAAPVQGVVQYKAWFSSSRSLATASTASISTSNHGTVSDDAANLGGQDCHTRSVGSRFS